MVELYNVSLAHLSNGIGSAEAEDESASNSDDDEAPSSEHDASASTTDALNDQKVKSFPQVLQEILNTPVYESIARWLPDGLSFIIADKRRFSDEILPKYFRRVASFHSFIRKLNRYGFRRVKGSCKGEESSFAHNNFVRDKPWLCLKMNCKSKPSYHKVPSKKKTTHHMTAATAVEAANSLTNTGLITMTMPAPVPPSFMGGVGGMMDASSRVFVSTPTTYLPAVSASVLPMATSAIGPPITIAAIQERQFLASMLPGHSQQRMLRERQMLMLQMRQRQEQELLQRLHEMSAYDGDRFLSSYDNYVQSSMMAQSRRDNMLRRNMFH
ncbi:heat shock factor family protein [Skeletonema marinoi]|uniref:Heat shock factor family protein n=1 Tax=Skeletonema marinoi TaxID=267567 RepID=A0AAD9D858_9STRA|nr:heat shock factor family protein [Skeletonema marinoi]